MTALVFFGEAVVDITDKWDISILPHSTIVYDNTRASNWFEVWINPDKNALFKRILIEVKNEDVPNEYKVKALLLT